MKRTSEEEAMRLSEVLCVGSSSDVSAALETLGDEELNEACTTIIASGHTVLHVLTQRQKVTSLQAILKRGVDVNTRNAQGTTAMHLALQHNALSSAKILIDHGASVSEVISRRKGTSLLHMLVTCDRPMAVRLLLTEGAEVDGRDLENRTPLHLAAIYGNLRIADLLLQHEGCNVNILDGSGRTPLMLAILNNNAELARHLSATSKTDVSIKDRAGMSALHLAVALGQVEVARAILNRNTANINSKERSMGRTPLHFACALNVSNNDTLTADDIANRNSDDSSIMSTITDNSTVSVDDLKHKPRPNSTESVDDIQHDPVNGLGDMSNVTGTSDTNGNIASEGDTDTDKHILEIETDAISPEEMVATNDDVQSAEKHSASQRREDRKGDQRPKTGKKNGCNNNMNESHDLTPSNATRNGGIIRRGISGSRKDQSSPIPGKEAAIFHPGSKLRLRASLAPAYHERSQATTENNIHTGHLSRSGTQLHTRYLPRSATQLRSGSKEVPSVNLTMRRPATAHARLSSTVMTSAKGRREFSPSLSLSSLSNSLSSRKDSARRASTVSFVLTPSNVGAVRCKMVALLLDHGADANLMTLFRKSPLHMVATLGASDVMALLLPHTTNPNMLSASNKTALHLAVEGGHTAIVSQLIHAGANLGLRDMSGMTALHSAARLGHADMVVMLLKGGAEKNSSDFKQMTPLHHACQNGHTDVIDILTKARCRTDMVDDQGILALDYADNCIAEKDETEEEQEIKEVSKPVTADERTTDSMRQRKTGAVYLPSPNLPTHVEV